MSSDRIRLRPLAGTVAQTLEPHSLEAEGIVINVSELYRRSGTDIEADARAVFGASSDAPEVRRLHIHRGIAAAVIPTTILPPEAHDIGDGGKLLDPIGRAVVAHPDGTLVAVSVLAWPGLADRNLAACNQLALRILETVEPGERKLDLVGGEQRLSHFFDDQDLVIDVPAGTVQEGHSHVSLTTMGEANEVPSHLDVDTFDYRRFVPGQRAAETPPAPPARLADLLPADGVCRPFPFAHGPLGWAYFENVSVPYPEPNSERGLTVEVHAPDPSGCERMMAIARTIRLTSSTSAPPAAAAAAVGHRDEAVKP